MISIRTVIEDNKKGDMRIASNTLRGGKSYNVYPSTLNAAIGEVVKPMRDKKVVKTTDGVEYSLTGGETVCYIGPAKCKNTDFGSYVVTSAKNIQDFCKLNEFKPAPIDAIDPNTEVVLFKPGLCIRLPKSSKYAANADFFSPVFTPLTLEEFRMMYETQKSQSAKFKRTQELSSVPKDADNMSLAELMALKKKGK